MNKDLIKYGLIALGAYLIYEYIQKNGCGAQQLSIIQLLTTTGIVLTSAQQAAICAGPGEQLNLSSILTPAQMAQYNTYGAAKSAANPPISPLTSVLPPSATAVIATPVGTVQTINGQQYRWNGSAWLNQTPANQPPAAAPAPLAISQQMLNLAGTNSLDMFQWAYYFTQLTGQPSPVDPNAIDPNVYAGAGIVDSSTPTDVGTWLAIMQNQAPQLGLMGLGARFTPAWLM
jgi:hypothetical protein